MLAVLVCKTHITIGQIALHLCFFRHFAKARCKNSLRGFLASNNFREISFPKYSQYVNF